MPGLLSQIGSRHKAVGKPMDCPALSIGAGFPVKFIVAVMRRHWPRGYCRWRGYLSNVAGDDNSPASHKRFRSMPYRIFRDIE